MPRSLDSPLTWMEYAKSDLAAARGPAPEGVMLETLCFHAQQAAEKSIKAVLVARGVPFPRIHSIERLTDLLPPDIARTADVLESARLTAYATVFRYPGMPDPVSEERYDEAVRLAEAVVS